MEGECWRDILDRGERPATGGRPYAEEEDKKQVPYPQETPFVKYTQGKRVRDAAFLGPRTI